jgi:predicted RNA-binding protein
MSVVLDHDGQQEKVMENVSLLEVVPEGVRISTLFEEPRIVAGRVQRIDFTAGTVTLADLETGGG